MNDHARIEELLAARALGGLEPEDERALARERAAHGPACEECARLERAYAETAGLLALALEPVPVREGLEDEVVARALGRPAGPSPGPRAFRRGGLVRGLAALGAAAALVAAGWFLRGLAAPGDGGGFTVVRFEGAAGGVLAVAFRPGEPGAYLLGADLPAPPEGKRYELWLIRDGRPRPGGCFAPEGGTVQMPVEGDIGAAELLAVTVEPAACPAAPTAEPILTASLEAV